MFLSLLRLCATRKTWFSAAVMVAGSIQSTAGNASPLILGPAIIRSSAQYSYETERARGERQSSYCCESRTGRYNQTVLGSPFQDLYAKSNVSTEFFPRIKLENKVQADTENLHNVFAGSSSNFTYELYIVGPETKLIDINYSGFFDNEPSPEIHSYGFDSYTVVQAYAQVYSEVGESMLFNLYPDREISGRYDFSGSVTVPTNSTIYVNLYAEASAAIEYEMPSSSNGRLTARSSFYLDPVFSLMTSDDRDYDLFFSPGIENGVSAVPLPKSILSFGLALSVLALASKTLGRKAFSRLPTSTA